MNTTVETDQKEIDRIAGRMVHRATDAKGFLIGIEAQINLIKARGPEADSGYETKLQDLSDRWVRLTRAIEDYEKAGKIIRLFPALLWAANAGLNQIDADIQGGCHGKDPKDQLRRDVQIIADLIRRAVSAGEGAVK